MGLIINSLSAKFRYLVATLLILIPLLTPALASAATNDQLFGACDDPNAQNSTFCKDRNKKENPVVNVINITATIIAMVAGIVAVIMIMIGGFNFITAGGVSPGQRSGDPNKIATAKNQITYALVGLIVIVFAWTLIRFVTDKVVK